MKVLIDTNILLLILFDDGMLTSDELKIIENQKNEIIISSISILEISLKYSIGKLELKNLTPDLIPGLLENDGYILDNMDSITFSTFYKLPRDIHKDPFDRLIIWESIRKEYFLLSRDYMFKEYKKYGLKMIE